MTFLIQGKKKELPLVNTLKKLINEQLNNENKDNLKNQNLIQVYVSKKKINDIKYLYLI